MDKENEILKAIDNLALIITEVRRDRNEIRHELKELKVAVKD